MNYDKTIDYIASGNYYVIFLGMITLVFYVAIFHGRKFQKFCYFVREFFGTKKKKEDLKQKNAVFIRTNLLFDRISSILLKIDSLVLSGDVGRNAFYHYLLKLALKSIYEEFRSIYEDYKSGKISEEDFCSYYQVYYKKIDLVKVKFAKELREKLKNDNWKDSDINYVIMLFNEWMMTHAGLLSELIMTCKYPEGVVMAWWIFYQELFINIEKFSFSINGRITGQKFENILIGKPQK